MKKFSIFLVALFASSIVFAQTDYSKVMLRARGVAVLPSPSADIEVIGGDVDISNAFIPELDISYFFSENIAVELILGTSRHEVTATGTSAGDINLGEVSLLPPTLTLQYHFVGESPIKPYVGAGLNYTIFFNADDFEVVNDLDYDSSLGFAGQVGLDYFINDKWLINLDVKYVQLGTDVKIDATDALGATVGADVDINPILIGLGVGLRL